MLMMIIMYVFIFLIKKTFVDEYELMNGVEYHATILINKILYGT